ncbi:MAG TPA: DUF3187 family protein [Pseudomonadales bacterium]
MGDARSERSNAPADGPDGGQPVDCRRIPIEGRAARMRSDIAVPLILACALLGEDASADARPFYLRNQNPFLQVLGVPAAEGARLVSAGRLESRLAITLVNHADSAEAGDEAVVLDGESWYVDTRFRYGLTDRWEIGIDLPYVAHDRGNLDHLIEGWHDLFGLSNGNREGPSNRLRLSYRSGDTTLIDLQDASSGLGDVRLTAALLLFDWDDSGTALALRGSVELPTGDESKLRGNDGADWALGLEAERHRQLGERDLALQAQIGALRPGDWTPLESRQKELVPYGMLGAAWQWRPRWRLRAQLGYQGSYLDSRLDELGGSTASLTFGGSVSFPRIGLELDVALIEDLVSDTTPDFGLYLALRRDAAMPAR